MSSRMAPHHCPYCSEEDLRPTETDGQWECRDCARIFSLRFVGLSGTAMSALHEATDSSTQTGKVNR